MKPKLLEHCAAVVFVTIALLVGLVLVNTLMRQGTSREPAAIRVFGDLSFVDFNNPLDLALLKDAINRSFPGRHDLNDSLYSAIVQFRQRRFAAKLHDSQVAQDLTWVRFFGITLMYAKFSSCTHCHDPDLLRRRDARRDPLCLHEKRGSVAANNDEGPYPAGVVLFASVRESSSSSARPM